MKNKITVTAANITFFAFAVAFISFQFVLIIPSLYSGDAEKYAVDNFAPITLISEYLLILVPVCVLVLIKRLNIKEVFRLNNPGFLPCLIIIFAAIPANYAASTVNDIVCYILGFIGSIPNPPIPAPNNIGDLIFGLFVIAVTPAICEELLNRGIMLKAYENRGTNKAIVISAVLFGVFHFSITNLAGPILLGLLIAYYVVKTNSIFAGMLAHFLNNAFSFVMMYFMSKHEKLPDRITISSADLGQSILFGAVAVLILVGLLKLLNKVAGDRAIIKPPISSVKRDIISIISHWPMIVVICLYVFMTLMVVLEIVMDSL